MPPEQNSTGYHTNRRTAKRLHMEHLPSSDYFLYTMMRQQLDLDSLRQVFVCGLRLMYACGHDPALRQILLNVVGDVRSTNLDAWIDTTQKDGIQPTYSYFPWADRL